NQKAALGMVRGLVGSEMRLRYSVHGQGGMGTKSHDIFTLPLCREHHNELHADPLAFEEKHGSQVDLIFRFLDHAFATGVLG
ncbi:DUF968 domain-containing protein, partial [Escherichia coli]|uniref:DUF968 domain-containing protein n=1 Tax=Escherichia coli TaxID=562 RepID=UPI00201A7799